MKIAFYDAKEYDIEKFDEVNRSFGHEIRYFYDRLNAANADLARGQQGVCVFVNDRVFEDTLLALHQIGVGCVLLRCAGYNNVDLETARRLGIAVANAPDYPPQAVAEHTVAMILSLNRKIHKAYHRTKEYNFSLRGLMGYNMKGRTVGIVGLGRIGRTTAELLQAFGCRLLAYDPLPDVEYARVRSIELVDLADLWPHCDILSLHCPLTTETRYIVNPQSIGRMKPGVMLINTSRGELIDTRAVIDGIKAGRIAQVGLDVYEEEENYFYRDFTDSILYDDTLLQLLALPNVLVTSHQAYFTHESLQAIAESTLRNARSIENGERAPFQIE